MNQDLLMSGYDNKVKQYFGCLQVCFSSCIKYVATYKPWEYSISATYIIVLLKGDFQRMSRVWRRNCI